MDRMSGEPKDRIGWGARSCTLVATLILVCLVYLTTHPDLADLEALHPYMAPALILVLLLLATASWLTETWEQLYVDAAPMSSTVIALVQSAPAIPVEHNDTYIDDSCLEVLPAASAGAPASNNQSRVAQPAPPTPQTTVRMPARGRKRLWARPASASARRLP